MIKVDKAEQRRKISKMKKAELVEYLSITLGLIEYMANADTIGDGQRQYDKSYIEEILNLPHIT